MSTPEWVPVIDVSRHQGPVNFGVMRSKGVAGVILRATHGFATDDAVARYQRGYREAGYRDTDVGYYSFCNPKRTSGEGGAKHFMEVVHDIRGNLDTFMMLDVEDYVKESGSRKVISGPAFEDWLVSFVMTLRAQAPECRPMMYSNAAYWDSWVGPSAELSKLDIIVARYPFYYENPPNPPQDASKWAAWILAATSKRPVVPRPWGTRWEGWQFAAGFNRQGAVYGCSSVDLDLNIVRTYAWNQWTRGTAAPEPPQPPDPVIVIPPVVVPPPVVVIDPPETKVASYNDLANTPGARMYFVRSNDPNDETVYLYNGFCLRRCRDEDEAAAAKFLFAIPNGYHDYDVSDGMKWTPERIATFAIG